MRKLALCAVTALLFLAACVAGPVASAQTYTKLFDFGVRGVGGHPYTGVIRDPAGNLYGTSQFGGVGLGTVYKVTVRGVATVLHTFRNGTNDGVNPFSELLRDSAGNLFGTTSKGGAFRKGTVYKLDRNFKETVLYSFAGSDGAFPSAGLVLDSAGNLYGTTAQGGNVKACQGFGCGVVFRLAPTGHLAVLHRFSGPDGRQPQATLLRDSSGNLYGTTEGGGPKDWGTVFKLNSAGKQTVLHTFSFSDGAGPTAPLIQDTAGNLYGTTAGGAPLGNGTVFKLDKTGHFTTLYGFSNGLVYGGLVADAAGNLYGTTWKGGAHKQGSIFEVDTAGNETDLYSFTGGADGQGLVAGLIRDSAGNLYGTTPNGGKYGYGVIFRLFP